MKRKKTCIIFHVVKHKDVCMRDDSIRLIGILIRKAIGSIWSDKIDKKNN